MGEQRDRLLRNIEVGDVIFARRDDGWIMFLLVEKATAAKIFARSITTQSHIEFRRDGISTLIDGKYRCEVVSTRPLPPEAYSVACALDRKMRLAQAPDGHMLTRSEKQFLSSAEGYFMARPLADADLPFRLPGPTDTPAEFDLSPPWRE